MTKELKELKDRAEKLARKTVNHGRDALARKKLAALLRSLHAPTLGVLDDAPVFVMSGSAHLPVFSDVMRGLPDRLEQDLTISEQDMRLVASLAEHALTRVSERNYPPIGRYPDRQAHTIADLLAAAYRDLTGREPKATTITYGDRRGKATGDYVRFVESVFDAMGIKRAAWSDALRAGHRQRGGRGRKK